METNQVDGGQRAAPQAGRDASFDELCQNTVRLVEYARRSAVKQLNLMQLMMFYAIGKWIVDTRQEGKCRAKYGKQVISRLSGALTERFGRGFSPDTLENARKFYLTYQERISETVFRKFAVERDETAIRSFADEPPFVLPWSHYLLLLRIKDPDERNFYEIEAAANGWSLVELKRQFNSALYERLALSRDKERVYRLAREGQKVNSPRDVVKDPYILEFLGLPELPEYSESELETRIIDHLQQFLLELGKGFAFIGRQVRLTFNEEHFRVDLVFYNRLLRCFVLFDLKIGELKHQDIGQMQMYVHYYDRAVKLEDENPTIGVILCKDKNDAIVELTLPEDNTQIFASRYETVLPSKEELRKLLNEHLSEEDGVWE